MSLILAGLVFAGTSGALFVGRWIAKRRAGASEGEETAADADAKAKTTTKKASGDGDDAGANGADDDAEKRAAAEVEAEVPTNKDDSDPALGDKDKPGDKDKRKEPTAKEKAKKLITSRVVQGEKPKLDGFLCQLGDVLMRITGEEAWLAGGVVLSEDMPVAVLFVAPDAGHDCAIYVRNRPSSSLFWLEPLDPKAILVGGEPPSSVEHNGIRFDRARRLPLRPRRVGVGAPDVGDAVVVAEYVSAGAERLLVLKANSGQVCAYRGLELEEGSFEVIASGETTLE